MEKPRYSKINNFCLIFLTGFAMTAALIFTKAALVPLVFSFFLYGIITSLVRWTSRNLKIGKPIATIFVLVVIFVIIYEIVSILMISTGELFANMVRYETDITILLKSLFEKLPFESYGFNIDGLIEQIHSMPYYSYARSITGVAFKIVGNLFLIFTFLFFFLLGEKKSDLENPLLKNILEKVTAYVSIKFFTSLLTGVLVGILLFIFNVNMFLLFGFVTFILNFIPNIGSTVATILPLPILLLQFGFGWQFFAALSLMILIHVCIGYVLDPKIMGESLDLHPVTILVFLVFWGLVWGIPGLFLAVPITSILKITLSRLENTRTIAEILSGRLPR